MSGDDVGEVMALDGPEISIFMLVWLVSIAVVGLVLYAIVRLGVKHGMRSYYAEAARRPDPMK